jgi:hypothetical protein
LLYTFIYEADIYEADIYEADIVELYSQALGQKGHGGCVPSQGFYPCTPPSVKWRPLYEAN